MQKSESLKIVVGTNSRRKMMVLNWVLSEINIDKFLTDKGYGEGDFASGDGVLPLALQSYFADYINNSDGKIKGDDEVFVGSYDYRGQKIAFYSRPTSGETKGNNPEEQARNKVNALVDRYKGRENALIIAMDTGDGPESLSEPLGKPENLEEYEGVAAAIAQNPEEEEYFLATFKRWYLDQFYRPGTKLSNKNGIAISRTFVGTDTVIESDRLVKLEALVPEDISERALIEVFLDSGGGGVFQQLIDWMSFDLHTHFAEGDIPNFWSTLPNREKRWVLYWQIIGMPIWAILDEVDKILEKQQEVFYYA